MDFPNKIKHIAKDCREGILNTATQSNHSNRVSKEVSGNLIHIL